MPPSSSPPQVVTLERAWHHYMTTLQLTNGGKVSAGKLILRTLRSQQGKR